MISRSCTTSWTDWGHGELVLTDEALVRRRLAEPTEAGKRLAPTASENEPLCDVPTPTDAEQLVALHPTNKYLMLDGVAIARLHRGLLSDRLTIVQTDGVRHKLLWLRVDPAHAILSQRLPALIGSRFAND